MSFIDKLKFWKQEEAPPDWMSKSEGMGEMETSYPAGGGPPFPTGLPPSTAPSEFGSLSPIGSAPLHEQGTISPAPPSYQIVRPQPLYQQVEAPLNKDVEILSLKLDAIRNVLDTINMRLERLEHLTRGERYFADREINKFV